MVTMFINIKALLFTKAFISRKTLAKLKHNYLLRGKYFLLCDNSIMGEPAHNLTLNYSSLTPYYNFLLSSQISSKLAYKSVP